MSYKSSAKFRSRKIDNKRPLAVYRASELQDLAELTNLSRAAPIVATGVEKEEEEEYHLQNALHSTQSGVSHHTTFIPTPDASKVINNYEKYYNRPFHQPKALIRHSVPMEETIGCLYNMDEQDELYYAEYMKDIKNGKIKNDAKLNKEQFEEIMQALETLTNQKFNDDLATLEELKEYMNTQLHPPPAPAYEYIYEYWKKRRIHRNRKPIQPFLKTEELKVDSDPYVCFRRREIKTLRKTRRCDALSLEKLKRLKNEMDRAHELMSMVCKREKLRKDSLLLEHKIFEQRILIRQMKKKLGVISNEKTQSDIENSNILSTFGDNINAPLDIQNNQNINMVQSNNVTHTRVKKKMKKSNLHYNNSDEHSKRLTIPKIKIRQSSVMLNDYNDSKQNDKSQIIENISRVKKSEEEKSGWIDIMDLLEPAEDIPYIHNGNKFFQPDISFSFDNKTVLSNKGNRHIAFGRRRIGRGGRLIFDRRVPLNEIKEMKRHHKQSIGLLGTPGSYEGIIKEKDGGKIKPKLPWLKYAYPQRQSDINYKWLDESSDIDDFESDEEIRIEAKNLAYESSLLNEADQMILQIKPTFPEQFNPQISTIKRNHTPMQYYQQSASSINSNSNSQQNNNLNPATTTSTSTSTSASTNPHANMIMNANINNINVPISTAPNSHSPTSLRIKNNISNISSLHSSASQVSQQSTYSTSSTTPTVAPANLLGNVANININNTASKISGSYQAANSTYSNMNESNTQTSPKNTNSSIKHSSIPSHDAKSTPVSTSTTTTAAATMTNTNTNINANTNTNSNTATTITTTGTNKNISSVINNNKNNLSSPKQLSMNNISSPSQKSHKTMPSPLIKKGSSNLSNQSLKLSNNTISSPSPKLANTMPSPSQKMINNMSSPSFKLNNAMSSSSQKINNDIASSPSHTINNTINATNNIKLKNLNAAMNSKSNTKINQVYNNLNQNGNIGLNNINNPAASYLSSTQTNKNARITSPYNSTKNINSHYANKIPQNALSTSKLNVYYSNMLMNANKHQQQQQLALHNNTSINNNDNQGQYPNNSSKTNSNASNPTATTTATTMATTQATSTTYQTSATASAMSSATTPQINSQGLVNGAMTNDGIMSSPRVNTSSAKTSSAARKTTRKDTPTMKAATQLKSDQTTPKTQSEEDAKSFTLRQIMQQAQKNAQQQQAQLQQHNNQNRMNISGNDTNNTSHLHNINSTQNSVSATSTLNANNVNLNKAAAAAASMNVNGVTLANAVAMNQNAVSLANAVAMNQNAVSLANAAAMNANNVSLANASANVNANAVLNSQLHNNRNNHSGLNGNAINISNMATNSNEMNAQSSPIVSTGNTHIPQNIQNVLMATQQQQNMLHENNMSVFGLSPSKALPINLVNTLNSQRQQQQNKILMTAAAAAAANQGTVGNQINQAALLQNQCIIPQQIRNAQIRLQQQLRNVMPNTYGQNISLNQQQAILYRQHQQQLFNAIQRQNAAVKMNMAAMPMMMGTPGSIPKGMTNTNSPPRQFIQHQFIPQQYQQLQAANNSQQHRNQNLLMMQQLKMMNSKHLAEQVNGNLNNNATLMMQNGIFNNLGSMQASANGILLGQQQQQQQRGNLNANNLVNGNMIGVKDDQHLKNTINDANNPSTTVMSDNPNTANVQAGNSNNKEMMDDKQQKILVGKPAA